MFKVHRLWRRVTFNQFFRFSKIEGEIGIYNGISRVIIPFDRIPSYLRSLLKENREHYQAVFKMYKEYVIEEPLKIIKDLKREYAVGDR